MSRKNGKNSVVVTSVEDETTAEAIEKALAEQTSTANPQTKTVAELVQDAVVAMNVAADALESTTKRWWNRGKASTCRKMAASLTKVVDHLSKKASPEAEARKAKTAEKKAAAAARHDAWMAKREASKAKKDEKNIARKAKYEALLAKINGAE